MHMSEAKLTTKMFFSHLVFSQEVHVGLRGSIWRKVKRHFHLRCKSPRHFLQRFKSGSAPALKFNKVGVVKKKK